VSDPEEAAARGGAHSPQGRKTTRVLLAGGRLFNQVVGKCLEGRPELTVAAADGPNGDLVDRLRESHFDLVVIDGSTDLEAGLKTVGTLADRLDHVEVVTVDLAAVADAVSFVEAGAHAYLLRDSGLDDLLRTLGEVRRGRAPCEPAVAALVLERLTRLADDAGAPAAPPGEPLTPREMEVLELLSDGLSNKEVAVRLGVALSTVKNHVHNLLTKMGVGRRGEAVKLAYQQGIIDRYLPLRKSVRGSGGGG